MIDITVKILIAYLLGSLLGSLIVGRICGGVDIRTQGSGNAGGTNALRTQGRWFALGVLLIDIAKGWIAAFVLPSVPLFEAALSAPTILWTAVGCSTAVVVGHVYPVFFGFRGGKGAATLLGVVLGIQPVAAIAVIGAWVCVLLVTGFVGLSTMLATAAFTIYQFGRGSEDEIVWFGVAMTCFVLFTHRSNLARMRAGTENRSTRFWLLRPK